MTPEEMKTRTKAFGLRVIRLVQALPRGREGDVIARQLLRCGTSVGANYRAACRSRSDGDFLARMGLVEEEADEAAYWLEIIVDAGLVAEARVAGLRKEADEIVSMVVASITTVKTRRAGQGRDRSVTWRPKSEIRNPKSAMGRKGP